MVQQNQTVRLCLRVIIYNCWRNLMLTVWWCVWVFVCCTFVQVSLSVGVGICGACEHCELEFWIVLVGVPTVLKELFGPLRAQGPITLSCKQHAAGRVNGARELEHRLSDSVQEGQIWKILMQLREKHSAPAVQDGCDVQLSGCMCVFRNLCITV